MKAAAVVVLFLSTFFIIAFPAVAAPKLKIGVVAPLSGIAASSGETVKKSILLASKKLDPEQEVEFIFEDDQLAPKNTVTAVNKLIELDRVDALIVFGTPTSLAVNGIAEAKKVPMIALSIVDKVVAGKSYVFKHWVTATRENDQITSEVKRRGYKKIAIISTINDAMLKLRDLFKHSAIAEIVADVELNKEDLDFKTIITKTLNSKPDAIYVLLWAPQPGIFVKQLREARFKGAIFGTHNLEDPKEVAISSGALVGSWLATGDDSAAKDFYADYEKAYKQRPSAGGANSYDVAKILIEGSQSKNLAEYLRTLNNFNGIFGTYGATGNNDFDIPAVIKIITTDGFDRVIK